MSEAALDRVSAALTHQQGLASFWLRPQAMLSGTTAEAAVADGRAIPLAGGAFGLAFAEVEIVLRDATTEAGMVGAVVSLERAKRWAAAASGVSARYEGQVRALTAPREAWAGLDFSRPRIMGILNVTPDSFSDGGDHLRPAKAIASGKAMLEAGADILDIGGESTRPGAEPLDPAEEIRR